MKQFDKLSEKEMWNVILHKKELTLTISDQIIKLPSNVEEVPPPLISEHELAQAFYYSAQGMEGRYIRFVVFIYALGGKIVYKDLRNGSYEAKVSW